jgi:hypothetical protein
MGFLAAANIFFWIFHTLLIVFNVFGWIWPRARKWNLVCLLATAVSWFVMGLRYGIGYCLCTDWHFQIREQMGIHDSADTYIQLLAAKLTGVMIPTTVLNPIAGIVFGVSIVMSVALNIRDWRATSPRRTK